MTTVCGISHLEPFIWYAHDTSVAVVQDSLIRGAVAEERFTRVKHYAGYPAHALDYFSKTYELDFDTFDVVAIPWPEQPGAPAKLTNNENPATSLEVLKHRGKAPRKKVVRVDHQTAHAATAFRTSGWKDALIISLDGGGLDSGEPSSEGLFIAEDYEIERQELYGTEANFGVFYGAITEALGWAYADGEGKTMGLAPYGDASRAHRMLSEFIPTVVGTSLRSNKTFLFADAFTFIPLTYATYVVGGFDIPFPIMFSALILWVVAMCLSAKEALTPK